MPMFPIRQAFALVLAFAMAQAVPAVAQTSVQPASEAVGLVAVIVEVRLEPNTEPAGALAAVNDMRLMMKKQPGYVSEVFLKNLNPDNAPDFVHVSRWASMAHWAALFRAPEFARLSSHGLEHYTITAKAFVAAE